MVTIKLEETEIPGAVLHVRWTKAERQSSRFAWLRVQNAASME